MCIIQTLLTRFIAFQADHAIYYPWHKSTIKSKPNMNNLLIRLMRTSYRKNKTIFNHRDSKYIFKRNFKNGFMF